MVLFAYLPSGTKALKTVNFRRPEVIDMVNPLIFPNSRHFFLLKRL